MADEPCAFTYESTTARLHRRAPEGTNREEPVITDERTPANIAIVAQRPRAAYDSTRRALVIHDLVVTDPAVIAEIQHWANGVRGPAVADDADLHGADLAPFCVQALAAGSLAFRGAGGTQEAHHLDRLIADVGARTSTASEEAARTTNAATVRATAALEKAATTAQQSIAEAARFTREALGQQVSESKRQLVEEIARLVGGDDPLLAGKLGGLLAEFGAKLDDRVGQRTDELFVKASRQLDPRDPTSPMAAVTKQLGEQHTTLLTQLGEGQKDLTERLEALSIAVHSSAASTEAASRTANVTTLKGSMYADAVHTQLAAFAATQGDEYLDTSGETGYLPRCKKGDGVLVVPTGATAAHVVIEMTDSDTVVRRWNDYLDEAERNRGAIVGLGLVRTVDQMPDGQRLRCFGPRRIVLAHDPAVDDPGLLRAVLLLLRSQAVLALGRAGGENLRTAEEKLTEAVSCLERLNEVQKHAGTIHRTADKVLADCSWLHTSLQRLLAEVGAALTTTPADHGDTSTDPVAA